MLTFRPDLLEVAESFIFYSKLYKDDCSECRNTQPTGAWIVCTLALTHNWSFTFQKVQREQGNENIHPLCTCRNRSAATLSCSHNSSHFNDSVNHSAHKELLKNPIFFSQFLQPRNTFVCRRLSLGCGELPTFLTEEICERNIFYHSFPPCLGQCTCHTVTWCNVRAVVIGSACVYVRYWTMARSLLNKENHSPFQQCFL